MIIILIIINNKYLKMIICTQNLCIKIFDMLVGKNLCLSYLFFKIQVVKLKWFPKELCQRASSQACLSKSCNPPKFIIKHQCCVPTHPDGIRRKTKALDELNDQTLSMLNKILFMTLFPQLKIQRSFCTTICFLSWFERKSLVITQVTR